MSKDIRTINGKSFYVVYNKETHKAEVYDERNEFCFEMNDEYDTDTENKYIKCWLDLENF